MRNVAICLALAAASPATGQDVPTKAAEAADRFTLDLPTGDTVAPPPEVPPEPAASAYSIDTPIVKLMENWRAKVVLDKNLPGLTIDKNFAKFGTFSLRQLQPQSGGRLTDALLEKTAKDLAAIPPPAP